MPTVQLFPPFIVCTATPVPVLPPTLPPTTSQTKTVVHAMASGSKTLLPDCIGRLVAFQVVPPLMVRTASSLPWEMGRL